MKKLRDDARRFDAGGYLGQAANAIDPTYGGAVNSAGLVSLQNMAQSAAPSLGAAEAGGRLFGVDPASLIFSSFVNYVLGRRRKWPDAVETTPEMATEDLYRYLQETEGAVPEGGTEGRDMQWLGLLERASELGMDDLVSTLQRDPNIATHLAGADDPLPTGYVRDEQGNVRDAATGAYWMVIDGRPVSRTPPLVPVPMPNQNAGGGGGGGSASGGGGSGSPVDLEHPWEYSNGTLTNVVTGEVIAAPSGYQWDEGGMYSDGDGEWGVPTDEAPAKPDITDENWVYIGYGVFQNPTTGATENVSSYPGYSLPGDIQVGQQYTVDSGGDVVGVGAGNGSGMGTGTGAGSGTGSGGGEGSGEGTGTGSGDGSGEGTGTGSGDGSGEGGDGYTPDLSGLLDQSVLSSGMEGFGAKKAGVAELKDAYIPPSLLDSILGILGGEGDKGSTVPYYSGGKVYPVDNVDEIIRLMRG